MLIINDNGCKILYNFCDNIRGSIL